MAFRQLHSSRDGKLEAHWPTGEAQTLHGVLISEPCKLLTTKPELTELALLTEVLSPLWGYLSLRELGYDDF